MCDIHLYVVLVTDVVLLFGHLLKSH